MSTGTVNAGIPSDAELIARLLESLREPYAYLRIDDSSETRSFGKREKEIVIEALTRLRASERKDSVSVPREPTEEMLNAAFEDYAAACYASPFGKEGSFAGAYRAMLAAAPLASPAAVGEELRCEVTGNLSGTDTWAVGYECKCASCQKMLREGNVAIAPAPRPVPEDVIERAAAAMFEDNPAFMDSDGTQAWTWDKIAEDQKGYWRRLARVAAGLLTGSAAEMRERCAEKAADYISRMLEGGYKIKAAECADAIRSLDPQEGK